MKELKVLTLVHESLVPPKKVTKKELEWAEWKTEYCVQNTLQKLGHQVRIVGVSQDLNLIQESIKSFSPDIVFNLLEEFNGEVLFEKNIVSLLELLGVPYTGCNPHGLAIGRDKAVAKKILNYHNISTPRFQVFQPNSPILISDSLEFPFIVKSLTDEASLGISQDSIVRNLAKLRERVQFIWDHLGSPALVEEYIDGRELYVGVLGNQSPQVLPIWELNFGNLSKRAIPIATERVKFNKKYCEKYDIKRGPAQNLSKSLRMKINEMSLKAYSSLRINGYARMDIRVTEQEEVYFLEVNPNPELAQGEDLANAAKHGGISYQKLIGRIIDMGLSWGKAA